MYISNKLCFLYLTSYVEKKFSPTSNNLYTKYTGFHTIIIAY